MSVATWFETFVKNLRMSSDTVDNIAYRYKRITRQLNKDFWESDSDVYHSLYVGSYGRDTDIVTSDIDMLFQLPYKIYERYNNYQGNGQSALLQAVKSSVEKTYKSYMRADGQVLVISFTDGIVFELLPAFINTNNSYTYPDTNNGGNWKNTNPRPEIKEISDKNILWNNNLKKLCRMIRAWKYKWDVPLGGLLIDTLCYNFLSQSEYKAKSYLYYDYITRDFFKYISEIDPNKEYWLSPGARQYVWKKGNFQYKAKQCYNLALEAISKETDYPFTAKTKWRDIYGTKFPS
ncbi:MAG: nucleotidyltransferase [Bacteroidetes bacterium 43-16]|mgnify:CR=1 FL=1|uniref:SMODS domain-containing nucleotidyltransferase n=1 Tax=uncultured Dysgonomonas sp. TaxID=206096 RepID=UPI000926C61D|nr:hypothetical protein [uncultured Dysgonomonas sp.]OJV51034.1 MAG: nucleotidyltransferase [Bacteroidetes bacterium 43-16]